MASLKDRLAHRLGYVPVADAEALIKAHLEVDRASKEWAYADGAHDGLSEAFDVLERDHPEASDQIRFRIDAPLEAAEEGWTALGHAARRLLEAYRRAGMYGIYVRQVGEEPPPSEEPSAGFKHRPEWDWPQHSRSPSAQAPDSTGPGFSRRSS